MSAELDSRLRHIVERFLAEADGVVPDLDEEDNLLEGGHLDSTRFFELIAVIEEELGLRVDFFEADPADLVSIAGLTRYLNEVSHDRARLQRP